MWVDQQHLRLRIHSNLSPRHTLLNDPATNSFHYRRSFTTHQCLVSRAVMTEYLRIRKYFMFEQKVYSSCVYHSPCYVITMHFNHFIFQPHMQTAVCTFFLFFIFENHTHHLQRHIFGVTQSLLKRLYFLSLMSTNCYFIVSIFVYHLMYC